MLWETVVLAYRAIRRNTLRSVLTVLGVVIGVGAVIAMVTLGSGTTEKVVSDISRLGTNLLTIRPGQGFGGPGGVRTAADDFAIADVEAIREQIANLSAVAPVEQASVVAVYGNDNRTTTAIGTDNDYLTAMQWELTSGREFSDGELSSGTAVCIIGATVKSNLFGDVDPVGDVVRLQKIPCRIIGVLAAKGQGGFGADQDDIVLVPIRMLQRRITGNTDISSIQVSVRDGISTAKVKSNIEYLLRERRRISDGEEDDFNVLDMTELTNTLTTTTTVLTGLLGAVAAVSLLVGGIGIMNIMLVSVTERTREIGIRLAIGALKRQVLMQFLIEAVVLSLFGGILGIALGLGLAAVAASYLSVPFVLSPSIIVGAFLFSAAVGVIFGFFPARRAANFDPIEALRHE
jgi:putative ABC transport system permease protein